jgi:hypothetical protein
MPEDNHHTREMEKGLIHDQPPVVADHAPPEGAQPGEQAFPFLPPPVAALGTAILG